MYNIYCIQFILYTQCIVYTIHYTVYSIQYTLYIHYTAGVANLLWWVGQKMKKFKSFLLRPKGHTVFVINSYFLPSSFKFLLMTFFCSSKVTKGHIWPTGHRLTTPAIQCTLYSIQITEYSLHYKM